MRHYYRLLPLTMAAFLIVSVGLAGCSKAGAVDLEYALAPLAEMPVEVQQAPVAVQQAYQFAVANPNVLEKIPCYCGCGAMGHTSNYSCYVADDITGGEVVFDNHALGCSICVDISQDTMRLLDQGKEVSEIFTFVDNAYARFGPPTPLEQ